MEEAALRKRNSRRCRRKRRGLLRSERGQAIVEYILILAIAIFFTRFIYFNKSFGFKASLDKTMLRLGSFLEQNLKSGAQVGSDGRQSLDGFVGTSTWTN